MEKVALVKLKEGTRDDWDGYMWNDPDQLSPRELYEGATALQPPLYVENQVSVAPTPKPRSVPVKDRREK